MDELHLSPSQRELLAGLPERFALASIDRVWIFPSHHARSRETGLFVLSILPEGDAGVDQRTLLTLRYAAETVKGKLQRTDQVVEEGSAPPERINKVIAGVVVRAGHETSEPYVLDIEGNPERWAEFLGWMGTAA